MMKGTRANPIVIYTDGSCISYKNPATRLKKGHGGWAFCIVADHGGSNIYRHGFMHAPQTNNTAELMAVLEALRWIWHAKLEDQHFLIRPDSTYVINGMISGWRHVAAETNFKGEKNGRLWRSLHLYAERIRHLKFLHVKGHAGNKYNDFCDRIAVNARRLGTKAILDAQNEER